MADNIKMKWYIFQIIKEIIVFSNGKETYTAIIAIVEDIPKILVISYMDIQLGTPYTTRTTETQNFMLQIKSQEEIINQ